MYQFHSYYSRELDVTRRTAAPRGSQKRKGQSSDTVQCSSTTQYARLGCSKNSCKVKLNSDVG